MTRKHLIAARPPAASDSRSAARGERIIGIPPGKHSAKDMQ
ncbi:MAG: hypothetical protein U1D06_10310 [Paracoccaceae bacterium]|nr:hypothetical protein [Paracoccaceae bacterium]